MESVKYYSGTDSPINACKKVNVYSKAWQHHKGRNSHHYEHWTDNYDIGTTCIQMPFKDAVEMICDYMGAARAYMGDDFSYLKEYEWWKKKKEYCNMHALTRRYIDIIISNMACDEDQNPYSIFNKNTLYEIYQTLDNNPAWRDIDIISAVCTRSSIEGGE